MFSLPPALSALGNWPRFVTWVAVPNPEHPGKFKKLPCDYRTGHVADAHDPNIWTTSEIALAVAPSWDKGYGSGAGFVFTSDDPFFFLDIDGCLQADGTWSAIAQELCARFAGAAIEVSHSGRGLHIFGRTAPLAHGTRNSALGLELYTSGRFVALTGDGAIGDSELDCTAILAAVVETYFAPQQHATDRGNWTVEAVPEYEGTDDDEILIARMLKAASKTAGAKFGGDAPLSLQNLWSGDVPENLRSEADQSLANHLAFWTGKNCERIERLMRMSGLVRDKWDAQSHRNYLTNTILKACAFVSSVYQTKRREDSAAAIAAVAPTPQPVAAGTVNPRGNGYEYLAVSAQTEFFQHCHYVSSEHAVFDLSRNALFPKTSFDVVYGGHVFFMDAARDKKTDSAFDALTKSLANEPRIVDALCFRPELPLGAVVQDGARSYLNSYVPYNCPSSPGDVSPFLDLLARMLPNANDRKLLIHYLASMAQNPGVKFQWWPVLQGVEGNGKTLIIAAMSYIMGEHYTHLPNAHAMARDGLKFNSWIDRKLFVGIEEIRLAGKREFLDEFKIIVTNERIPCEGKGTNQTNTDNRANGILCTNHPDGVPIDENNRRYAMFFTAQQVVEDLTRDGMTGDYFPRLYGWFKGGGAAHIAHYLKTFALEAAFDPAQLCKRAPMTSTRNDAVEASRGRIEQEIIEAIEESRVGFIYPWVSSKYLDILIDQNHGYIPRAKRRDVLRSLGYDWHPAFKDGRVNNAVTPDNAKPRLFCKRGSEDWSLPSGVAAERAYSKAQEAPAMSRLAAIPPPAPMPTVSAT